jgi:hypothetical protein
MSFWKEIKYSRQRDQVLFGKRSSPFWKEIKSFWKRDQVLFGKRCGTLGKEAVLVGKMRRDRDIDIKAL